MPDARASDVRSLVDRLRSTDLRPGPLVDHLFRRLVGLALTVGPDHPALRCQAGLTDVRELCARGEALLEAHWAARVADDPAALAEFPYLDNYRRLAQGELGAIVAASGRVPRRLVFAGSGPLPLTAVLLSRAAPELEITCLDVDRSALSQGRRVVRALAGGLGRIRFRLADAATYDYSGQDVVLVASLAGPSSAAKRAVLAGVARTLGPGALLAARSVPPDGRRLLYPRIEGGHLPAELRVIGEWTPPPGVINSLLLAAAREAVPAEVTIRVSGTRHGSPRCVSNSSGHA